MNLSTTLWSKTTKSVAYGPLLQEDGYDYSSEHSSAKANRSRHLCHTLLSAFAAGIVVTLLVVLPLHIFWLRLGWDHACTIQTTWPSPVTKDVEIRYHTQRFNGSFFKETIYRHEASPEVDAAWKALGVDYRPGIISEEEAMAAGLRLDQVRLSDKYGGGFIAYVDGLHQLHCLNLLRKSLPWNIEYYEALGTGAFVNNRTVLRTHVTHCLDSIRQQLMCSVDVGLLGEVWFWPTDPGVEGPRPFVDFNTQHKCRNFDDVRQWAEARQMPDFHSSLPEDYLRWPRGGDRILDGTP